MAMTTKDYYEELIQITNAVEVENKNDVLEFLVKKIEQENAKSEKAKAKAAEKKAATDVLGKEVVAALTDEFQSADEIFATVMASTEVEEVTLGKVRSRLSACVRDGVAVKEEVKKEDAEKKCMCYKLA